MSYFPCSRIRGELIDSFDSRVQADRAIQALNNNIHPVSGERMQARVADSDVSQVSFTARSCRKGVALILSASERLQATALDRRQSA